MSILEGRKSKIIIYFLGIVSICLVLQKDYAILINRSDSLSSRLFILHKGKKDIQIDSLVAYKLNRNARFSKETIYLKRVGGLSGDYIKVDNGKFYNGSIFLGIAKRYDKQGEVTGMQIEGIVPSNSFFVYSLHPDSYDSKYKEVGYVHSDSVLGVAYAIF